LPHAITRVTGPIIRDVAADRTEASVVREFCGFDNRGRVRLKDASEMIRRVGIGAEEPHVFGLLAQVIS
jgi:hypothetical protein